MRSHPELRKGYWSYDAENGEWLRHDGIRIYARCHVSFNADGGEIYYTRWYKEKDGKVEQVWDIGRWTWI